VTRLRDTEETQVTSIVPEQVFELLTRAKENPTASLGSSKRQKRDGRRLRRRDDGRRADCVSQRAEHYEMAVRDAGGVARGWVQKAGGSAAGTLDEEEAADEKLTSIAESGVNQEAADAAHSSTKREEEAVKSPRAGRQRRWT
jgi:ferritin-like metal-binding protein YciE